MDFNLQKLVYYDIREHYGLSAQMIIRAITKVIEVSESEPINPKRNFWSEMGIINIAVDSNNTVHFWKKTQST